MHERDDITLLREFAATESEAAFATLVQRHVNLVHSVALRSTGSSHAAQEISQAVFIILARKANSWPQHAVLSGWLYQTTRLTSANFLRGEIRRQKREQEAYMQSTLNESEPEAWRQVAPLLDDALDKLGERDRNAIVLRFFENKNLRDVGAGLGVNEDAAKMRVTRAVEKLRKLFLKRGVALSAVAITGAVAANSVQAAPLALAKSVTAVAMMKGVAASGSTLTLIKGVIKIMAWTKIKTAVVVGGVILLAAGTTAVMVQHQHQRLPRPLPVASGQTEFPKTSWHFAGYANPESALLSCMWAVGQDDANTLLAGLAPAMREKLTGKPAAEIITAKDRADFAGTTGYQILGKQVVSENEVIFEIHAQGLEQTVKFSLQQIGGEWKFAGKAKQ
jgi:RNA polymerase sigma factor (sigma-70 family)